MYQTIVGVDRSLLAVCTICSTKRFDQAWRQAYQHALLAMIYLLYQRCMIGNQALTGVVGNNLHSSTFIQPIRAISSASSERPVDIRKVAGLSPISP